MRLEEFLTEDQLDELNLAKAIGNFASATVNTAKRAKRAAQGQIAATKAAYRDAQDQAGKAVMSKEIAKGKEPTATAVPKAKIFAGLQDTIAKLTPDQKVALQIELERVKV